MPAITILIAPLRLQYDQMIAPTHLLSQPDNDRANTPAIYEQDNNHTDTPAIYQPNDRAYTPTINRPTDRQSSILNHYYYRCWYRTTT